MLSGSVGRKTGRRWADRTVSERGRFLKIGPMTLPCILLLAWPARAVELGAIDAPRPEIRQAAPTAAALPVQLPLPFVQAEEPAAAGIAAAIPAAISAPQAVSAGLRETAKAAAPALAAAADPAAPGEASAASAEEAFERLRAAGLNVPHRLPDASVEAITPRIVHLNFKDHYQLATTFLRFQEHYESPKFRGKVFSHEEYMDWYAATHGGKFSYVEDWEGFNIPSRVLRRFYKGDFDPLWNKERAFLDLFRGKKGRFYVIGTSGENGDPETLRHEIAHGLFYTVPAYKREVLAVLKTLDLSQVFGFLGKDQGYHPRVFLDEAHAYILNDLEWLGKKQGVDIAPLRQASVKLNEIFARYLAKARS